MLVNSGAVVSSTVIVCVAEVLLPSSVAVNVHNCVVASCVTSDSLAGHFDRHLTVVVSTVASSKIRSSEHSDV